MCYPVGIPFRRVEAGRYPPRYPDREVREDERIVVGDVYYDEGERADCCDVEVVSEGATRVLIFKWLHYRGYAVRIDDNGTVRPGLFAIIIERIRDAFMLAEFHQRL